MNVEIEFFLKVFRNGCVLAALYFVSVWAVGDLTMQMVKPVFVFLLTYITSELAVRYKLKGVVVNAPRSSATFVF